MAVPLIAGVTAAGRGLAAYLAKRRAIKEIGKQAVMRAGYGAGKTAVHPRTAAMTNLRGRTYPSDAARIANTPAPFVNAPKRFTPGYKTGLGVGSIGTLAGIETARRMHPRDEAMKARRDAERIANAQAVTGMTGAITTPEELKRIKQIQGLNMTPEAKKMLLDDLTSGAGEYDVEIDGKTYGYEFDERPTDETLRGLIGAGYTGNEIDTFMGMPVSAGRFRGRKGRAESLGDTAEWNPSEGIYPRHFIDTLLEQGVITLEEVFDMGASDGDSFKIIPRGTGRFDSTRRA